MGRQEVHTLRGVDLWVRNCVISASSLPLAAGTFSHHSFPINLHVTVRVHAGAINTMCATICVRGREGVVGHVFPKSEIHKSVGRGRGWESAQYVGQQQARAGKECRRPKGQSTYDVRFGLGEGGYQTRKCSMGCCLNSIL